MNNAASTLNLLRTLLVVFTALVGSQVAGIFRLSASAGLIIGIALGLLMVLVDRLLKGVSLRLFSAATFGLLMGTVFAHLLRSSDVLRGLPPDAQWAVSLLLYVTAGYFGTMLALRSNRQDFSLVIPYVQFRRSAVQDVPLLLDASALVDGRVAELCATGFLSSSLIIPRFVVDHLRQLSTAPGVLARTRGRRALDYLQSLQRNPSLFITVQEAELTEQQTMESSLVQLVQVLGARLLTSDNELYSVARLQGISPLNLQDLERVMQPSLAQGDHLEILLTKEGREAHQAVGYLPSGPMVIVNHAHEYIGSTVPVKISSIVPTQAGKLFFAELE